MVSTVMLSNAKHLLHIKVAHKKIVQQVSLLHDFFICSILYLSYFYYFSRMILKIIG